MSKKRSQERQEAAPLLGGDVSESAPDTKNASSRAGTYGTNGVAVLLAVAAVAGVLVLTITGMELLDVSDEKILDSFLVEKAHVVADERTVDVALHLRKRSSLHYNALQLDTGSCSVHWKETTMEEGEAGPRTQTRLLGTLSAPRVQLANGNVFQGLVRQSQPESARTMSTKETIRLEDLDEANMRRFLAAAATADSAASTVKMSCTASLTPTLWGMIPMAAKRVSGHFSFPLHSEGTTTDNAETTHATEEVADSARSLTTSADHLHPQQEHSHHGTGHTQKQQQQQQHQHQHQQDEEARYYWVTQTSASEAALVINLPQIKQDLNLAALLPSSVKSVMLSVPEMRYLAGSSVAVVDTEEQLEAEERTEAWDVHIPRIHTELLIPTAAGAETESSNVAAHSEDDFVHVRVTCAGANAETAWVRSMYAGMVHQGPPDELRGSCTLLSPAATAAMTLREDSEVSIVLQAVPAHKVRTQEEFDDYSTAHDETELEKHINILQRIAGPTHTARTTVLQEANPEAVRAQANLQASFRAFTNSRDVGGETLNVAPRQLWDVDVDIDDDANTEFTCVNVDLDGSANITACFDLEDDSLYSYVTGFVENAKVLQGSYIAWWIGDGPDLFFESYGLASSGDGMNTNITSYTLLDNPAQYFWSVHVVESAHAETETVALAAWHDENDGDGLYLAGTSSVVMTDVRTLDQLANITGSIVYTDDPFRTPSGTSGYLELAALSSDATTTLRWVQGDDTGLEDDDWLGGHNNTINGTLDGMMNMTGNGSADDGTGGYYDVVYLWETDARSFLSLEWDDRKGDIVVAGWASYEDEAEYSEKAILADTAFQYSQDESVMAMFTVGEGHSDIVADATLLQNRSLWWYNDTSNSWVTSSTHTIDWVQEWFSIAASSMWTTDTDDSGSSSSDSWEGDSSEDEASAFASTTLLSVVWQEESLLNASLLLDYEREDDCSEGGWTAHLQDWDDDNREQLSVFYRTYWVFESGFRQFHWATVEWEHSALASALLQTDISLDDEHASTSLVFGEASQWWLDADGEDIWVRWNEKWLDAQAALRWKDEHKDMSHSGGSETRRLLGGAESSIQCYDDTLYNVSALVLFTEEETQDGSSNGRFLFRAGDTESRDSWRWVYWADNSTLSWNDSFVLVPITQWEPAHEGMLDIAWASDETDGDSFEFWASAQNGVDDVPAVALFSGKTNEDEQSMASTLRLGEAYNAGTTSMDPAYWVRELVHVHTSGAWDDDSFGPQYNTTLQAYVDVMVSMDFDTLLNATMDAVYTDHKSFMDGDKDGLVWVMLTDDRATTATPFWMPDDDNLADNFWAIMTVDWEIFSWGWDSDMRLKSASDGELLANTTGHLVCNTDEDHAYARAVDRLHGSEEAFIWAEAFFSGEEGTVTVLGDDNDEDEITITFPEVEGFASMLRLQGEEVYDIELGTLPEKEITFPPTATPTMVPSAFPSHSPTVRPTGAPTPYPTTQPTAAPTDYPSHYPTHYPSSSPSAIPTEYPSISPSSSPSSMPTNYPSLSPTRSPTAFPTEGGSAAQYAPTHFPTLLPTTYPTTVPTPAPTQIMYPILDSPISAIGNVDEVSVTVEIDRAGTVFCALFTEDNSADVTSSEIEVDAQSVTLAKETPGTLTFVGLDPLTTLYGACFARDTSGAFSTPDQFIQSEYTFTTATTCCRGTSISKPSVWMYESTISSALTITLESNPSSAVTVTIAVYENPTSGRCDGTASQVLSGVTLGTDWTTSTTLVAQPSSFTVTNTSSVLDMDFVLVAGVVLASKCTAFTVSLSGDSAAEYDAVDDSIMSVLDTTAEPIAPLMSTALFDTTGSLITVTFDSDTDRASETGSFDCDTLFWFTSVASASCLWSSDSELVITLDSTASNLPEVGDNITIFNETLKAYCSADPVSECDDWEYTTAHQATIAEPETPVVPIPIISGPEDISTCDEAEWNMLLSENSGGREFASIEWSIGILGAANDNFTASDTDAISITAGDLDAREYVVTLTLENFFGRSATTTVFVSVSSIPKPSVVVVGGSSQTFNAFDHVVVEAQGTPPDATSCSVNASSLTFEWEFLNSNIESSSVNPRVLRVSARRLTPGASYQAQVTVSMDAGVLGTITNTALVTIKIAQSDLVASITDRGATASVNSDLELDGSNSFDPDFKSRGTNGLSFEWECMEVSPTFGDDCFDTTGVTMDDDTLTVDSSLLVATEVWRFTLIVGDADDANRDTSTDEFTITLQTQECPSQDLWQTRAIHNVGRRVPVFALLTAADDSASYMTYTWTLESGEFEGEVALSEAVTTSVSGTLQRSSGLVILNIDGDYTLPGVTYTLNLAVQSFDSSGSSLDSGCYAPVDVETNRPPTPGSIRISPPDNATIGETDITLQAVSWSDVHTPFRYYWAADDGIATRVISRASRDSSFDFVWYSEPFPAPSAENATEVTVYLIVQDSLGAPTRVSQTYNLFAGSDDLDSLEDTVNDKVNEALQNKDPQAVNEVLSAGGRLRSGNCRSSCNRGQNREACSSVVGQCGDCLSGYEGPRGPSSGRCSRSRGGRGGGRRLEESDGVAVAWDLGVDRRLADDCPDPTGVDGDCGGSGVNCTRCGLNDTCDADSDCDSGYCDAGLCAIPLRSCPNNCSGNGTCTGYDIHTGETIPMSECLVTNTECRAFCDCDTGSYGEQCSLTAAGFASQQDFVHTMIVAAQTSESLTDSSESEVGIILGALEDSTSKPHLLLWSDLADVMQMVVNVLEYYVDNDGYTSTIATSALTVGSNVLTRVLLGVIQGNMSSTEVAEYHHLMNVTQQMASVAASAMAETAVLGEDFGDVEFDLLLGTFGVLDASSGEDVSFTVPVTDDEEWFLNSTGTLQVTFLDTYLSACDADNDDGFFVFATQDLLGSRIMGLEDALGTTLRFGRGETSEYLGDTVLDGDGVADVQITLTQYAASVDTETLYESSTHTVECEDGDTSSTTVECPGAAADEVVTCSGDGDYTVEVVCGQVDRGSRCAVWLGGSDGVDGTICWPTDTTEFSTTCACDFFTADCVPVASTFSVFGNSTGMSSVFESAAATLTTAEDNEVTTMAAEDDADDTGKDDSSGGSSFPAYLIVVIVLAGVLGVVLIGGAVYHVRNRRQSGGVAPAPSSAHTTTVPVQNLEPVIPGQDNEATL